VTGRDHDIVLFGATGFTGALTAEYLTRTLGATGWALAGRNRDKLEAVRRRLAEIDPAASELPLLPADVDDLASIRAVAESSRVAITTVGPYIRYGEPLVAACAAAGTDYVDLTGEPEFVDRMWLRYHDQAQRSGARLVHSCGFDSVPYDLGALFSVQQLPEDVPIKLQGFVRVGGSFSGGTYHSAIEIMSRLRQGASVARERREREAGPPAARSGVSPGRLIMTRPLVAGSSRCRRSIRSPCCAPRGRSIATGLTSPTATIWSPNDCRCWRAWSAAPGW